VVPTVSYFVILLYFGIFITPLFRVKQLDGSTVPAQGYGVIVIQPINKLHLLALWHSYYNNNAPQYTFSPNAIKHYLLLPSVITSHTNNLNIIFPSDVILNFLSIPYIVSSIGLDFFYVDIIKPKYISQPPIDPVVRVKQHPSTLPPIAMYVNPTKIIRVILHQLIGHISDDVLEPMYHKQTLTYSPPPVMV
jgi:hypothetical protein